MHIIIKAASTTNIIESYAKTRRMKKSIFNWVTITHED